MVASRSAKGTGGRTSGARGVVDVTHLIAPGRAGGLERVVEMLAVGHAELGHRVSAVAIVHEGSDEPPMLARLRSGGVDVSVVTTSGRSYRIEKERVRAVLVPRPRGVIHSHGYRADVLHLPTAAALGFPTVSTLHGFTGGDLKNRIYEYVQRRSCRRADLVVAVSGPIAERMRASGVRSDRIRTVRNAYVAPGPVVSRAAARAKLGLSASDWIAGFVGRLSSEKGPDVLLESLTFLRDLPIRVAFVGDGREASALRARADQLGISDRVHWIPVVDQAASLFSAFDAFVLSSRTEGTPIALFEAMNAGTPIVAASVGGVPDVVTSNEAILVAAESASSIADAMRDVYSDACAAAARAARAAARLSTGFAAGPWLQHYESLYREVLDRKPERTQ